MKRMLLTLSATALLAGLSGCCCHRFGDLPGCLFSRCRDCPSETTACGEPGCESCGEAACDTCGGEGCQAGCRRRVLGRGIAGRGQETFTPGPATAAVTYPYYTIRGPRDFLAEDPPSIGP